jgi:glycine betaine/proline transport system substrate-binding protein
MSLENHCLAFVMAFVLMGVAQADEPASCKTVRFATAGWADIFATTVLASVALEREKR